jgi:hypothetical protein
MPLHTDTLPERVTAHPGAPLPSGSNADSKTDPPTSDQTRRPCPWLDAALFLITWLPAAAMALYLKWFTMADLGGFSRSQHASGYVTLSFTKHLSFFNGEIFLGLLLIPAILLLANRYLGLLLGRRLGKWFPAIFTPLVSMACILVFAIQLYALQETGRYISLHLVFMGISYGLHEPGAINYLSLRALAFVTLGLAAIVVATIWAAKRAGHLYLPRTLKFLRTAGELWILFIAVVLASGWQTGEFRTPYHQSTFTRGFTSLWREKAVDTGEFSAFDPDRLKQLNLTPLDSLSNSELIARYRDLAHAPTPYNDPRYFGKEAGDNVLFFILETFPDEFLPVSDDLSQFPNLKRLRERSFVADRHYATFPFTQCAIFSVFSSWYPLDTLHRVRGFNADQIAPDFLDHLNHDGYVSVAFSPLPPLETADDVIYGAIGFKSHVELSPADVLPQVDGLGAQSDWPAHRVASDIATLHKLESHLDQWNASHQKFVAAYFPQVGHFPYPDQLHDWHGGDVRARGRAILAMEDQWLGELLDRLTQNHQLDHTIIVIFGDHGRRNIHENPNLRRGTIDETAFHVPLMIYSPRALDHTEHITWLTSHIDIAPTVLDLLGVQRDAQTEQGVAMWNRDLPSRTTFLFAQPLFGADGYYSNDNFFMLHYYSDMVYKSPRAFFDDSSYVMRGSPTDRDVRSSLAQIVPLISTWQSRFASKPIP